MGKYPHPRFLLPLYIAYFLLIMYRDKETAHEVSFTIEAGEKVAILGRTGR